MIVKTPAELDALVREVLMASGADERNAEIVAEHLVLANLSGVDTHGVWHLKGYVDAIADGLIIPTAWPEVLSARANSARVTGHSTFGQTAALFAMRQCLDMAKLATWPAWAWSRPTILAASATTSKWPQPGA